MASFEKETYITRAFQKLSARSSFFAHQRNVFGQAVYKFYGIFKTDLTRSNNVYHNRVEECIDLIKYQ